MAVSYGRIFATAHDATGGVLALDVPRPGVAYAPVVDLLESPDVLADALDLPWRRSFRHGFCWGLLVPDGSRLLVVVMGRDGPDLAGDGVVAGRLSDEDTARWAPLWGGRPVRVSVLVEATPGLFDLEVRFRTNVVADHAPEVPAAHPGIGPAVPSVALLGAAVPEDDAVASPAYLGPDLGVAVGDPFPRPVPEPAAAVVADPVAQSATELTAPAVSDPAPVPAGDLTAPLAAEPAYDLAVEPAYGRAVEPAYDLAAEPATALAAEPLADLAEASGWPAPESPDHAGATDDEHPVAAAVEEVPGPAVEEPAPGPVVEESTPVLAEPPAPAVLDLGLLGPPDAPAAWYVDPSDESSWRWWDGSRWTTDAAPRPRPGDGSGTA